MDSDGRKDDCSCTTGASKMCIACVLVGAGVGVYVGYRFPEPSLIPNRLVLFGC